MVVRPVPNPEFEVLPLKLAYTFLETNGLGTEATSIRTSREHIGSHSTSTSRRAKIVELLRRNGLLDKFIETHWKNGLTPVGRTKLQYYDRVYGEYQHGGAEVTNPPKDDDFEGGTEFALEEDLRDYLAKNLGILEAGLSLWPLEGEEDAVEFQVDEQGPSRRVDILAKGTQSLSSSR